MNWPKRQTCCCCTLNNNSNWVKVWWKHDMESLRKAMNALTCRRALSLHHRFDECEQSNIINNEMRYKFGVWVEWDSPCVLCNQSERIRVEGKRRKFFVRVWGKSSFSFAACWEFMIGICFFRFSFAFFGSIYCVTQACHIHARESHTKSLWCTFQCQLSFLTCSSLLEWWFSAISCQKRK